MNAMTTCPQCGATMRTHGRDGRPRTYCSYTCGELNKRAREDAQGVSATARADDAETLLTSGSNPAEVARRLGLSLGSMGRIMRRAGRADLAVTFERAVAGTRSGACVDCGVRTSGSPGHARCIPCGYAYRGAAA